LNVALKPMLVLMFGCSLFHAQGAESSFLLAPMFEGPAMFSIMNWDLPKGLKVHLESVTKPGTGSADLIDKYEKVMGLDVYRVTFSGYTAPGKVRMTFGAGPIHAGGGFTVALDGSEARPMEPTSVDPKTAHRLIPSMLDSNPNLTFVKDHGAWLVVVTGN
jgi:hypothetical protein